MSREAFLRTKLIPPRPQRHSLVRPRVLNLARQALDYRVTILQASTGYGKSTALAHLAQNGTALFWYTATESDRDPQQFLAHLIAAFQTASPTVNEIPHLFLQYPYPNEVRRAADALINVLSGVITRPTLFVIDDYHFAASPEVDTLVEYFLSFLPADLHAIVSTRYPPPWGQLPSWRAHGQVLELKHDALAFTRDEIETLFRDQYALPLAPHDLDLLAEKTEGWSAALQLVWQGLRANPQTEVAALLSAPDSSHGSLDTLFTYLARDVLAQQPPALQNFMLQTSVLREIDPAACQALTCTDCQQVFAELRERDLFLIALGDNTYRYQHLFHDFLYAHALAANRAQVAELHRCAAEFFRAAGDLAEAIYHLLRAEEFDQAGALIEQAGEDALRNGTLDTLAGWIEQIPAVTIERRPALLFYGGELARLGSRFDKALSWHSQAERIWRAAENRVGIARALRGQALVYLDILQTPEAEKLLQEALRLNDGTADYETQARLLEMLAENKLNMGRVGEAENLRRQARDLREDISGEDTLSVRVKLRTGHLDEAREILETWVREEQGQRLPPRGHRETALLLSLIYSAQGAADDAFATAQAGLALGARLDSPYISAVAQMRLGHAHQIRGELREALQCYEKQVALGDQIAIPRVRAEACWGLARAYGLVGDLAAAQRAATEGIEIGRSAGDLWIVAQIQLALGAAQVLAASDRQGIETLVEALIAFHGCGDAFGSTAAWMWLAFADWRLGERERALSHLDEALVVAQAKHYDYLLTTRTLLGWHDPCMFLPVLIAAQQRPKRAAYVRQLLAAMGLTDVTRHPGYQVRFQTLGPFRVWRGGAQVPRQAWQRKKARQLLQLLIAHRTRMLGREEIFELLWPNESPDVAARDFKVTLNALNKALEPGRAADQAVAFITREESGYGLSSGIDVWIDAHEFTQLIARADALQNSDAALDLYRRALALYHDDFLRLDAPYEDWALAEREHLQTLYLRVADRLARGALERGELDECEAWCRQILARDRCSEHAYRLMMQAASQRGDTIQMRRTFNECVRVLQEDLGVPPSPATRQVLKQASGT